MFWSKCHRRVPAARPDELGTVGCTSRGRRRARRKSRRERRYRRGHPLAAARRAEALRRAPPCAARLVWSDRTRAWPTDGGLAEQRSSIAPLDATPPERRRRMVASRALRHARRGLARVGPSPLSRASRRADTRAECVRCDLLTLALFGARLCRPRHAAPPREGRQRRRVAGGTRRRRAFAQARVGGRGRRLDLWWRGRRRGRCAAVCTLDAP